MELEYKFLLPEDLTVETIISDEIWSQFSNSAWSKHHYIARYFDTSDYLLAQNLIALRVRKEDSAFVMTLKLPKASADAFSLRYEWNLNWTNNAPDIKYLLDKLNTELPEKSKEILASLQDRQLFSDLMTDIYRYKTVLTYNASRVEAVLDAGILKGGDLSENCYEMELELLDGKDEDLHELAKIVQTHFDLKPEQASKMARAIKLRNKSLYNS